jgi:hypothetical protein
VNSTHERLPAALLWDLDNVVVPRRLMPDLVDALKHLVEPGEPLVAAARRRTYRATRGFLTDNGFEAISGGVRPSGADKELLQRARQLMLQGIGQFVVASNDGRFELLARRSPICVVTTRPDELSRRLRTAAYGVLDLSGICTGKDG